MAKTIVGIDIGSCRLKLALCSGGVPRRLVAEDMPDNLVREGRIVSPETMAQFIRKTAAKARVKTRACAVILPATAVFTRTMTLPIMTRDNLEVNLPFEFRDFITQEKDKYFYDYAVMDTLLDEKGQPSELELIAAATLKETIKAYGDMCRRAGMKLVTAIPEELSYMNLIRHLGARDSEALEREYCFIDLGHTATRLHIFHGLKLQATRVVDLGMLTLDAAIAETLNTDEHIARAHKQANTNGILESEACAGVYANISIEVMRAINFYRFNSPNSSLSEVFLCGGGASIDPLAARLETDIGIPVRRVGELMPKPGERGDATLFPSAIGATMQ